MTFWILWFTADFERVRKLNRMLSLVTRISENKRYANELSRADPGGTEWLFAQLGVEYYKNKDQNRHHVTMYNTLPSTSHPPLKRHSGSATAVYCIIVRVSVDLHMWWWWWSMMMILIIIYIYQSNNNNYNLPKWEIIKVNINCLPHGQVLHDWIV